MTDRVLEAAAHTPGIAEIEMEPVDGRVKGIPSGTAPFPLGEISDRGWNVLKGDLPLPLAVLRASALDQNSRWMREFLRRSGAVIAPHGKTTMSPQLFQRQIEDGAWGITVATVQQLQVCREHGIQRLFLANQIVDRGSVDYILRELRRDRDFDFYCIADSVPGVRLLADAVRDSGLDRPLQVLVEVGFQNGRTGARGREEAERVARAVKESEPFLLLRGVTGFEGLIAGASPEAIERGVAAFLEVIAEVAAACDHADLYGGDPVIISAGGSSFYDLVARRFGEIELTRPTLVVVRSGCYLTHDSRMYEDQIPRMVARSPELASMQPRPRPALEVWAYVQSRPEPDRVILTVGKRDCSYDAGLPIPRRWYRPDRHPDPQPLGQGHRVIDLNDQHAMLEVPAESPLTFGDMVMLGISHPCTTFDKWQIVPVVDDDYQVIGAIRTFF